MFALTSSSLAAVFFLKGRHRCIGKLVSTRLRHFSFSEIVGFLRMPWRLFMLRRNCSERGSRSRDFGISVHLGGLLTANYKDFSYLTKFANFTIFGNFPNSPTRKAVSHGLDFKRSFDYLVLGQSLVCRRTQADPPETAYRGLSKRSPSLPDFLSLPLPANASDSKPMRDIFGP